MDAKTIDNRIRRAFNGIRQAFRGKIARVKAAGGVQKIQVEGLEGETVQDLEHAENFGFCGANGSQASNIAERIFLFGSS